MIALGGGPGDVDVLFSRAGTDTFIVATEGGLTGPLLYSVNIDDFADGEDVIDLSDLRDADGNVLDFADILDNATTDASGTVLDLSSFTAADDRAVSGTLALTNVTDAAVLTADDFVFDNGIDWLALLPAGVDLT